MIEQCSCLILPQGLVKGPRPDYYYTNFTLVPVIILMISNANLKVLVWDEYLDEARRLLVLAVDLARELHPTLDAQLDELLDKTANGEYARFGMQVLGIRDVKGAEFDDVVVLNFFCANNPPKNPKNPDSSDVWRSIPKSSEKSWKSLVQSEDAGAVSKSIDLQVELQLKMLYTAVSRCRCRLVFFESEVSTSGPVFFRKLQDLDFISTEADANEIQYDDHKGKTRVSDDWACEAVPPPSSSCFRVGSRSS